MNKMKHGKVFRLILITFLHYNINNCGIKKHVFSIVSVTQFTDDEHKAEQDLSPCKV